MIITVSFAVLYLPSPNTFQKIIYDFCFYIFFPSDMRSAMHSHMNLVKLKCILSLLRTENVWERGGEEGQVLHGILNLWGCAFILMTQNPSIIEHSGIKATEHFRNELGAIFKMTFSLIFFPFLLLCFVVCRGLILMCLQKKYGSVYIFFPDCFVRETVPYFYFVVAIFFFFFFFLINIQ